MDILCGLLGRSGSSRRQRSGFEGHCRCPVGSLPPIGYEFYPEWCDGHPVCEVPLRVDRECQLRFFGCGSAPAHGDFEVQINRQNGTSIKGRDAAVFQDLSPLASSTNAWYNIWVIANNGDRLIAGLYPIG